MMRTTQKDQRWQPKEPTKYWFVDITLTSGEELQFYISAKDKEQAEFKANDYVKLADNKSLREFYKGFKLLP